MKNLFLLQQKTNVLTRSLFFAQPCFVQKSFNSQRVPNSFDKNDTNRPLFFNFDNIIKQFSTQKTSNSTLTEKIIASKQEKLTNGYTIYVKDHFKDIRSKNPGVSAKETISLLAKSWKAMPFEEKMTYSNMAKENRQSIKENIEELLSKEPQDKIDEAKKSLTQIRLQRRKELAQYRKIREIHRLNKPPKPRNSFQLYTETLKRGDAGITDFIKGAAEKWKALAEQDKEEFNIRAKELKEDYEKKIKEWELKMIELNKLNLVRKRTLVELNGKLKEQKLSGKKKKMPKKSPKPERRSQSKKRKALNCH